MKFNCTADEVVKRLVDRYNTRYMGAQYIYISVISREYINIYVVDRYGILGDVSSEAVTRRLEQESEALEREKVVSLIF